MKNVKDYLVMLEELERQSPLPPQPAVEQLGESYSDMMKRLRREALED